MFDTTFHAKTIARRIRSSDFHSTLWQATPADKDAIVGEAVAIALEGFQGLALRTNNVGGKTVYRQASLPESLITRQLSETIKQITSVKQSDRKSIVKSLIALTQEGLAFKVYKFDIKSFYESIDTQVILERLKGDAIFSRQSVSILESFFDTLRAQNIPGLPRGIGLSATLAEYALREFDSKLSSQNGLRFYSRYVDDGIAVFCDSADMAEVESFTKAALPAGLALNRSKTRSSGFKSYAKSNTGVCEHKLLFLGYCLSIGQVLRVDGRLERIVKVDISPKKVNRLKLRLSKSLLAFNNNGTYADLHGRIRLLTSNFSYDDSATGHRRIAGLKYNYSLIEPSSSVALASLDRFLRNALLCNDPLNRLRPNLTKAQRQQLLGLRFTTGFIENRFFTFGQADLERFVSCWAHA